MSKFIEFRQSIQSCIDLWQKNLKAIKEYTPELLDTSTEHTAAYITLTNHIMDLQNDLNELNSDLEKEQSNSCEEELEETVKKIKDKCDELSKGLTSEMLLHGFADALIKQEQEFESFSSKIDDIYRAALVDNLRPKNQLPSKLANELFSLINPKNVNVPEKYKDSLQKIKDLVTTSLYGSISAQSALEEIKDKVKYDQTDVQEIISSDLSTEGKMAMLIDKLSRDHLYIERFIVSFTELQCQYEVNQQLQADIKAQLKKLKSHYPKYKGLQVLIDNWDSELNKLDGMMHENQKPDDLSKLNEQLIQFKNKLERDDYFKQAKEAITNELNLFEGNLIRIINENERTIEKVYSKIGNASPPSRLSQLNEKHKTESRELKILFKKYKNNHSKKESFSELLTPEKNIFDEIDDQYTTEYELRSL